MVHPANQTILHFQSKINGMQDGKRSHANRSKARPVSSPALDGDTKNAKKTGCGWYADEVGGFRVSCMVNGVLMAKNLAADLRG